MSVNGTLVEDKMRGFKGECAHFSFNKNPIYTHDSASAKFSTNSQETDNSVVSKNPSVQKFKFDLNKKCTKKSFSQKTVLPIEIEIFEVPENRLFGKNLFLGALFTKVKCKFLISVYKGGFFDTPFDLFKEKKSFHLIVECTFYELKSLQ